MPRPVTVNKGATYSAVSCFLQAKTQCVRHVRAFAAYPLAHYASRAPFHAAQLCLYNT